MPFQRARRLSRAAPSFLHLRVRIVRVRTTWNYGIPGETGRLLGGFERLLRGKDIRERSDLVNATRSGDMSPSWQSQLGSPGSVGQEFIGRLMRSREHSLMTPDTNHSVLTAGFDSGSTLSVAARSSDGQTIIPYLSDGNATAKTINMSAITSTSSSAKAWWYNPQTGSATLIGTFPNSGWQSFTAPDGNDWVLVIDDASANLPAPGSATLSQNSGTQVTTLTCSPNSVIGGSSSACQVGLNKHAPSGGAAVDLTNSNTSALSVPASVMVSAGASTGTFAASAAKVDTPQSAIVTATLNGSSSTTLSVQAPVLVSSLACSPTTINSGGTSSCTITLNQGSPSGGTTVNLTNSNAAVLAVPASVKVDSGASTATFSAAAAVVTASQSATITATVGTSSQSISITIVYANNAPPSVSIVTPAAGQTVSGTITLSANASDNVGVAWVQFKVDGTAVGPRITAAPYNYSRHNFPYECDTHNFCCRERSFREYGEGGDHCHREQSVQPDRSGSDCGEGFVCCQQFLIPFILVEQDGRQSHSRRV